MRPVASSALYHPLDDILGSSALVRVSRVLASHGGSLAVSDIAQRAKLTLPSVRAAVRRLLALEILTSAGAGRSLLYTLRRDHPLADALVALFRAEREQADLLFRTLRESAKRMRPAPLAIWLYGSVARGEDDAASDVDIALVSADPHPSVQADAFREAIANALPDRARRVAVAGLALKDVRRLARARGKFWRELERDAVVLFGDAPAGIRQSANRVGATS